MMQKKWTYQLAEFEPPERSIKKKDHSSLLLWGLVTCWSLGEAETVCVVHLWTPRLLTGHQLARVSAAEALVLPFFGHLHLGRLAFHLSLSLLPAPLVIITGLVLHNVHSKKSSLKIGFRFCIHIQKKCMLKCSLCLSNPFYLRMANKHQQN